MKRILGLVVSMLLVSNMAFAEITFSPSPWTKEDGWKNKAGQKLLFGTKNLLLGWTSIIKTPYDHHESAGATMKSLGMGMMMAPMNMLGGLMHVLTFPITNLDIPIPCGGVVD